MDYQAVRKKYTLYTRGAGILTMLLILCVTFAVSEITMRTGGLLAIVAGLALAIYLINKWYLSNVEKLLYVNLDFASWKQYIETNKEAKRAVLRLDAVTSEVSLAYMTGDFETAIRKAKEILSQDGLPLQYRNVLQSYLTRSVVLSQPELSRDELGEMIGELTITDPTLAEKTKKMSVALYDLTIAHESNDYFETLTNEYKYPQIEIIYYKALNAEIKGDTVRARELLSQLAGEDERLYVVRRGKEILSRESYMTNEEYYQVLEDYINELKQLREQAKDLGIMMVGENLTLDELFFISALNRRVRFIDGFIQLLKSRNLTCAGVLVRTQLDNLMRVYAAFIANDKGNFVKEYLAGTPIRNLVDDKNKKMTDSHLKKRISKIFPEFEKVYNKASGYVHLSEVALHEAFWSDKDDRLHFTVGIEPREELNVVLIESAQVFCYFTEIEFDLYTQVSESKKNLDKMLNENQSDKSEN